MRAISIAIPLAIAAGSAFVLWEQTAPPARPTGALPRGDDRPAPPGAATYGDFTVQTATGSLSLSSLRGQAVVLYFGYTSCPDICPTTLASMKAAFRRLSEAERARATLLFVGVDPKRDDVGRLAEYAGYFDPSFRAGTAEPEALEAITRDWGVYVRYADGEGSALDYMVDHSTSAFLLDPDGELVRTLPHGMPPAEVAEAIRAALDR